MKASKGLYSSVNCDCDRGFEGAILFYGLRLQRGLRRCYTPIRATTVPQLDEKVNIQFQNIAPGKSLAGAQQPQVLREAPPPEVTGIRSLLIRATFGSFHMTQTLMPYRLTACTALPYSAQ